MKIGIIGSGSMGRVLGLGWARNGHQVLFGSRDLQKAKALAAETSAGAAGSFDDAAAFGELVLYTVREVPPTSLLEQPAALDGKIVVDCNNGAIYGFDRAHPEGKSGLSFPPTTPSLAQRLAAVLPAARVVKAFNTIPAALIEAAGPARLQRALAPVAGDDVAAKQQVMALARELGFVAIDAGGLEQTPLLESVADFVRYQLLAQSIPLGTLAWTSEVPS